MIDFYCIGFVVAFMMTVHLLQDNNHVGWLDILFSIFVGVFSWVGVLALLTGRYLKRNSEHYEKNNS